MSRINGTAIKGFLLTRQWQDTVKGILLEYWFCTDQGAVKVVIEGQRAIFFIHQDDVNAVSKILQQYSGIEIKPLKLLSFELKPVAAVYFNSQQQLYRTREKLQANGIRYFEADIGPAERYLTERFITSTALIEASVAGEQFSQFLNPRLKPANYQPQFRLLSIDIETAYDSQQLFSISLLSENFKKALMLGKPEIISHTQTAMTDYIEFIDTEAGLLSRFIELITDFDPDIVMGWNVINFDFRFLQRKAEQLNIAFRLGRQSTLPVWRRARTEQQHYFMLVPGRVVLDGVDTLKCATWKFENYSLEHVGQQMLGRGKLIQSEGRYGHDPLAKARQIKRLFSHDKFALAAYNLEDCQLVWDIFAKADLINFAIERSSLTGLEMDRVGGSVAAFDNLYLPRLHRKGFVAPDISAHREQLVAPGGYVMESQSGLYDSVLVLDYKSLYPSIIRTFMIDPLGRVVAETQADDVVPGFNGARFSRHQSILPGIIKSLWNARDTAKREENQPLSQAIKIIMNSFYGVLGTPGCRIHDARLTSSITLRGHEIIRQTVRLIELQGFDVIYGDTDSVFVAMGQALNNQQANQIGSQLASKVNDYWKATLKQQYNLQSWLEMEFETHFVRFFIPTIRGAGRGSKKRYAGMIDNGPANDKIIFKGLETVRTDWTPLARDVQQQVYSRVFRSQPYKEYLRDVVSQLKKGQLDDRLIYRKRLRQKLSDYKKNIPPHAQAALKASSAMMAAGDYSNPYQYGGWIEYVITVNGPEAMGYNSSALDYQHYIDKQLVPVVDAILSLSQTSLEKLVQDQYELF